MPNWTKLPSDKIFHQPDQEDFLNARRARICKTCKNPDGSVFEYKVEGDVFVCPGCGKKGLRSFERLCIIAGRRWGKTVVGSLAALEEACIPNSIVWCCAPSNPKLHRYIIPAMQKLIPPEWVQSWSSEYGDLRLKNGSLIHFQTLEDPDQGRGQGLDALWIDEVCELTKAHWDVIRPSLGDKQGVAFFTTSPRSYDWVWKLLYKPALDGVPGHYGLHARTIDNPLFQSAEGKAFIERERSQMSDEMFRQEYEADFVNFTGAVYGSLLEPQILRTNEAIKEIIPEWPEIAPWRQVLVGIDTGADHPFGAVKLISSEKGLVCVGEYLARNKTFQIHAAALHQLAPGHQVRWAINKNEKQQTLELAQHGIYPAPAENDVVAGTERVKSWLGAQQLYFVENLCPLTIEQLRTYRWAENTSPKDDSKRTEKVYKKDDELPDCLRYALMTWPELPRVIRPDTSRRDISKLPLDMQQTIQEVRKMNDAEVNAQKEPETATGDFWGTANEDPLI